MFVTYQLVENLAVARRVEARTVHVGPFLTPAAGIVGFELRGITGALSAILLVTVVVTVADETGSAAWSETDQLSHFRSRTTRYWA